MPGDGTRRDRRGDAAFSAVDTCHQLHGGVGAGSRRDWVWVEAAPVSQSAGLIPEDSQTL